MVDNLGAPPSLALYPCSLSEKQPPLAPVVSVCEALPDTLPFIFLQRASMQRASEPLPEALCTARAPLDRLHSTLLSPSPQTGAHAQADQGQELPLSHQRRRPERSDSTRSARASSCRSSRSDRPRPQPLSAPLSIACVGLSVLGLRMCLRARRDAVEANGELFSARSFCGLLCTSAAHILRV